MATKYYRSCPEPALFHHDGSDTSDCDHCYECPECGANELAGEEHDAQCSNGDDVDDTTALALRETIRRLQALGHQGVAVIDQGGGHFLALAVGRDGKTCDPRNWDTHPTPEAALANLCEKLLVADPKHTPTVAQAMRHPREFVDGFSEV